MRRMSDLIHKALSSTIVDTGMSLPAVVGLAALSLGATYLAITLAFLF